MHLGIREIDEEELRNIENQNAQAKNEESNVETAAAATETLQFNLIDKFIEIPLEQQKSAGRLTLESWLNRNMRIEMTDGRILIGVFLCTDRDQNVILGTCTEHLKLEENEQAEEPRVLGLAMVPGPHIVRIRVQQPLEKVSEIV